MLFNSLNFLFFFTFVYFTYWVILNNKTKSQNIFLLITSYSFYAFWDWRFLFLLVFSILLDFYTGIKISKGKTTYSKKIWLWLSIIINLGFLGLFKYFNFFIETFSNLLMILGLKVNALTLKIILPVGISFYTFHGLSYVIDVYKEKIKPEKKFTDYSLFVCFFPLLVAGPIERATHLLPQIKKNRHFDYDKTIIALKQILWGLFKKVVIADQCAIYANQIFENHSELSGSTLLLGAIMFTFQIYGDFSGYTDIALGTSRLLGFELLQNFNYPYFSRNISEFWRRWHISLSSWFKDYIYIPLGGNKGSLMKKIRNTLIIFLISGFWHGANWTFILWGLLNGFYITISIFLNDIKPKKDINSDYIEKLNFKELISILSTFFLIVISWIIFRAENLSKAYKYISNIFNKTLFTLPTIKPVQTIILLLIFVLFEWNGRKNEFAIENTMVKSNRIVRWTFFYTLIFIIFYFSGHEEQFIYFQF